MLAGATAPSDSRNGVGGNGKRGDIAGPDRGRSFTDRGFDVVRVVVAAIDDDEVLDPPGQVQLAVDVHAEIAGGQPAAVVRSALGMAANIEPRLKLVAEYPSGFVLAAEVAAADVVAVQPDFAHGTVGHLRAVRVGDHRPLLGDRLAARDMGDRARRRRRDGHRAAGAELLPVEEDGAGRGILGDAGDRQRRFRHPVGRLDRRRGQTIRGERVGEFLDGRHGHGLGPVEQAHHVAEVEVPRPFGGSPRWAVNSKAKFGAAAIVRPQVAAIPNCLIHR